MNNNLKLLILTIIFLVSGSTLALKGIEDNLNSRIVESIPQKQLNIEHQESSVSGRVRAQVIEVVDGDTIKVQIKAEEKTVRYIGIDTPETVDPRRPVGCFGKEASEENKKLVEGKVVELEKDITDTDKYGRLLRYVYIPYDDKNSVFVNDYLVRQGFALSYTYPPDVKYQSRFNQAQNEARSQNRGLWEKCPL